MDPRQLTAGESGRTDEDGIQPGGEAAGRAPTDPGDPPVATPDRARGPAPATPDRPADKDRFERALRFLDKKISRAIRDYDLVGEGDRVMVALSGGKDSLVLLHALARRRRWHREQYELVACHVQGGLCGGACSLASLLAGVCRDLGVPFRLVQQELGGPSEDATGRRTRLSPCFVCSWHRRKALFAQAEADGCGSVAFGHHKDDIAQTLLLNLLWQGRHESMLPRQPMFDGRVTIIRPLALVDESETARIARLGGLPAHVCPCPHAERSKREVAGEIIRLAREAGCHNVTSNLVASALRGRDLLNGHDNGRY
jgi:tRNA 2-thiocytidine biosynthesis protein TtcA